MLILAAMAVLAVLCAFYAGRDSGVREAHQTAIQPGAWVEVVRPARYSGTMPGWPTKIPAGTVAVVISRDRWNRLSLWIAHPWSEHWPGQPAVYQVEPLTALRTIPERRITSHVLTVTMNALSSWEQQNCEMDERLFPPGALELFRKLNNP